MQLNTHPQCSLQFLRGDESIESSIELELISMDSQCEINVQFVADKRRRTLRAVGERATLRIGDRFTLHQLFYPFEVRYMPTTSSSSLSSSFLSFATNVNNKESISASNVIQKSASLSSLSSSSSSSLRQASLKSFFQNSNQEKNSNANNTKSTPVLITSTGMNNSSSKSLGGEPRAKRAKTNNTADEAAAAAAAAASLRAFNSILHNTDELSSSSTRTKYIREHSASTVVWKASAWSRAFAEARAAARNRYAQPPRHLRTFVFEATNCAIERGFYYAQDKGEDSGDIGDVKLVRLDAQRLHAGVRRTCRIAVPREWARVRNATEDEAKDTSTTQTTSSSSTLISPSTSAAAFSASFDATGDSATHPMTAIAARSVEAHDQCIITVENVDCIIATIKLLDEGLNPCLLNMANETRAGGGFLSGAGAQEENIFRRTNLYQHLCLPNSPRFSSRSDLYPIATGGALYSPDVVCIRSCEDTGYAFLSQPRHLSIVSVAADARPPTARNARGERELTAEYARRAALKIRALFYAAHCNGHTSIVVSALGCGAFGQPATHVARLFAAVIEQCGFRRAFRRIVFAILDDANAVRPDNPKGNFLPFKELFEAETQDIQ